MKLGCKIRPRFSMGEDLPDDTFLREYYGAGVDDLFLTNLLNQLIGRFGWALLNVRMVQQADDVAVLESGAIF